MSITIRGGFTIEFSEMRGPNKIFGSFCKINEPNILFGPLISENSIVTPPLVLFILGIGKINNTILLSTHKGTYDEFFPRILKLPLFVIVLFLS